jgi:hypothetical protein
MPPPPPSLEQVLAKHTQMLQNMQAAQPQVPPPPLSNRLEDFQCTKLPNFSHPVEPMDADD